MPTITRQQYLKHQRGSRLERQFADWCANRGIPIDREVELVPGRKFRFDFVHLPTKTAIEIQGAVFARGRKGHTSASGISRDAEKIVLCQLCGFLIWPLTEMNMRHQGFMDLLESRLRGIKRNGMEPNIRRRPAELF